MYWRITALDNLKKELSLVNKEIDRQLESISAEHEQQALPPSYFNKALDYHFSKPGKCLRAGLLLLSAYAVCGREEREIPGLIRMAAGIELIHAASLVHDDIVDRSEYRRNQYSLQKEFGPATALLIGDILYAQFFSLIVGLDCLAPLQRERILTLFCRSIRGMCFGEILENQYLKSDVKPSFPEYIKILSLKTAFIIGVGCHCGALLGGADRGTQQAMERFGLNLGIAYQLLDDYLDRDSLLKDETDTLGESALYLKEAKTIMEKVHRNAGNKWSEALLEICNSLAAFSGNAAMQTVLSS